MENVDSDQEPNHAIYIRDVGKPSRELLLTYGRHASVLWVTSGRVLVVTDYEGSDSSTAYLFRLAKGSQRTNLREELRRQVPEARDLLTNHHAYVEAVCSEDAGSLVVRLHGYGDSQPEGFDRLYRYRVESGVFQATRGPVCSACGG